MVELLKSISHVCMMGTGVIGLMLCGCIFWQSRFLKKYDASFKMQKLYCRISFITAALLMLFVLFAIFDNLSCWILKQDGFHFFCLLLNVAASGVYLGIIFLPAYRKLYSKPMDFSKPVSYLVTARKSEWLRYHKELPENSVVVRCYNCGHKLILTEPDALEAVASESRIACNQCANKKKKFYEEVIDDIRKNTP